MPAALVAQLSRCSGHGCFPPRQAIQGSPNININNKPAHRLQDLWDNHTCTGTHNGNLSVASTKTFWNNKGAGRVGDAISCGSTAMTGSSDTFID